MAITLTQLNAFLAVVRTGSVRAAAEQLVVTQPSVSAALSALSRELGVDLTERVGRGLRPSTAGEAFAPYAADVVGLLDQGRRAAREAGEAAARELRIAAVTTAAEYLAPPLLKAFGQTHPDVRLTLEVANRRRVFRRLVDHVSDVVVGGRPPPGEAIVSQPFLDNEMVLITAPEDPLAARRAVDPAELVDRTWLLREEGSGTRAFNEQYLADHDLSPTVLTLGSNGAIKQAARAGLGISLVSRLAAVLELEASLLAALPVPDIPRRQWFVHRSDVGPVRAPVQAFMAFVATPAAATAIHSALSFDGAPVKRGTRVNL